MRMQSHDNLLHWPDLAAERLPWTRWWWLGSAVDRAGITTALESYKKAGLGGVEITPIYGVRGAEASDIPYLSDEWVAMLTHAIDEARRLGMRVDMPTGTGWPFGGPQVTDDAALDKLVLERGTSGRYEARIGWAGRTVKRAAPGAEGKCINPFSRRSLERYLERFDHALAGLPRAALRCHFHDSFEYLADWSPDLLAEFRERRGYDLSEHLDALAGDGHSEKAARVRTDYRETVSDLLLENFTRPWAEWAREKGSLARNQAHGSPGNLLDLYAAADIPETEIFGGPGDPLVSKFASSAAHVAGRRLASSESCTWLGEHFTVTLGQCKDAIDLLLLAGINHVFYHGTAYSPSGAPWPGWLFYASTTFAPQDPLWRDMPVLNAYVARCQAILQDGAPDNDVLLYWPLHDVWQKRPELFQLTIDGGWLREEPCGRTARWLWERGYAFDYISDRQLARAAVSGGAVRTECGASYRAIVVPACRFMPVETLESLRSLTAEGAAVIFVDTLPEDIPGLGDLHARRLRFRAALAGLGGRKVVASDLDTPLKAAGALREPLVDLCGAPPVRRRRGGDSPRGLDYFIANRSGTAIDRMVVLGAEFTHAALLDPMDGRTGAARVDAPDRVHLQLLPGQSVVVRTCFERPDSPPWEYARPAGDPMPLSGEWSIEFVDGGPVLPASLVTRSLASWTELAGDDGARFAGTACYTLTFDAPAFDAGADQWLLDLGIVADSALVRFNRRPAGAVLASPFVVRVGPLLPTGNVLEVEVTNVAANRIRDLDRRGEQWRIFRDINFVNRNYEPFDASAWPIRAAGLIGPVTLTPLQAI